MSVMTDPQAITVEHLQALLDTQDAASIIGLVEGETRVIPGAGREDEANLGALEVISREALVDNLGSDPSEEELRAQAEALTTSSQELGG